MSRGHFYKAVETWKMTAGGISFHSVTLPMKSSSSLQYDLSILQLLLNSFPMLPGACSYMAWKPSWGGTIKGTAPHLH